jgi:hypothetical protein
MTQASGDCSGAHTEGYRRKGVSHLARAVSAILRVAQAS